MIVTSVNTGWEVIHQQAHGMLALQVALHWHPDNRPTHWIETLVALTEHDDGQDEWSERNHLTDAGAPLDFNLLQYSVAQCRNMIQIGLEKSCWNALLLSMHTTYLYDSKRGQDSALDQFLDQQRTNQQKWRRQYKASKAEAAYAYAFLQWCDALSLILAQNKLPPDQRRLEISLGPDGTAYYICQRSDQTLSVDPWPFDVATFTVHIEVASLHQLAFANDHALYNAMQDAPIAVREWIFKQ